MRQTIRGPFRRGDRCAPIVRQALDLCVQSTLIFALALALLTGGAVSSRADDDIVLAESGIFADSGFGQMQGFFTGTHNINALLGAERFYNAGFTGSAAIMANIEAGYTWSGHEALSHVAQIPTSGSAAGEFDRHATWVSLLMGGRPGGANPGHYQLGMAPDAQFFSGAIATSWPQGNSSFPRFTASFFLSPSSISTYGPYRAAMVNGLAAAGGTTRTADVINSSWIGTTSTTGTDQFSSVFDALANENPRTLLVTVAGNTSPSGVGPNRVPSPGAGYNDLTVAALTPNGGAFDTFSAFSNGGPNDYSDPVNGFIAIARQSVDIAAPGETLSTAYYGGQTGGNGPGVFGPPAGLPGGPDYYSRAVQGTSFATPLVTGGAALLYDAAHTVFTANGDARDARVMKAVLKNSADKTLGWNNGQVAHPNGNGGVLTTTGLDDRVGAGRMNLDNAFDQFLSGTTDVAGTAGGSLGPVETIGWDFGHVAQGTPNDYLLDQPLAGGSTFTATLDWFRDRATSGLTSYVDQSLDNLDLELWRASGGLATALVAESKSIYNNFEHFSFAIPSTGEYLLRVRWTSEIFDTIGDVNAEHYGLAWAGLAIPEPTTLALLAIAFPALCMGRRTQGHRASC